MNKEVSKNYIHHILGPNCNVGINGNGFRYCLLQGYEMNDQSNLFYEIYKSLGPEIKIYDFVDRCHGEKRIDLLKEKVRIVTHHFTEEESLKYVTDFKEAEPYYYGEKYLPNGPFDSFMGYIKSDLIPDWKNLIKPFLWSNEDIDNESDVNNRLATIFSTVCAAYIIYKTPDARFHVRIYVHKNLSII